jgi:hypothetical protein
MCASDGRGFARRRDGRPFRRHASQVAAMGSGSVFMVNVVKAMVRSGPDAEARLGPLGDPVRAQEPIVGTAVSFLGTGKVAGWKSNGSLLPIVAGVSRTPASRACGSTVLRERRRPNGFRL